VQDYQEFQIIVHQIKEILPYKFPVYVTISDVLSQLLFVLLLLMLHISKTGTEICLHADGAQDLTKVCSQTLNVIKISNVIMCLLIIIQKVHNLKDKSIQEMNGSIHYQFCLLKKKRQAK
jgi:hypothetical protein